MSAEAERRTENLPEWKREEVADLAATIGSYESVGVVDVAGIPSRQLQEMRRDLHGTAELRVSRNTLIRRALEEVDEGVEALAPYVERQVGLIGTDDNPFGLYKQLEASKTPAPIGAGEVSPNDVVIPEGDTGVDPGPFISDLQAVGAAARIQDGSIHVTEESTVLEAGEEVSDQLANVLAELGIEPKEVGLDLRAVVSDGVLFEAGELDVDIDDYRADVETAAARARNLAIDAAVPTDRTTTALLTAALGEAKSLGLRAAIESPDLADDLVSRADAQVRALAARIDDETALPEELRDVEAPAAPAEETTEDDADREESTDETEPAEAADDDDDDDDEEGAEGLGAMFG